jgi:type VI secretion system protein ImpB
LVLILTDCVAETWYDGGTAQLLETWARNGPVGLLLVLPEHLWPRTALGTAAAVRLTAPFAAAANVRLDARPIDAWTYLPDEGSVPIPVASLVPEALSAWARLVAGAGGADSAGFVLERKPSASPLAPPAPQSPRVQLSRFWKTASPMARRLAGLLAASPVINLAVIRLVREALLPEARQVHEAEVLLGDLLRVSTPPGEAIRDPDELRYEFRAGLRSHLLDAVPAADALSVLERVSSYVEEHLESGVDFRAVLADPASASGSLVADESPFARVAAEVLLRLGGDYARLVATLPADEAALADAPGSAGGAGFAAPPGRIGPAPPLEDPPTLSRAADTRSRPSLQQKLSRVRPPRAHITYEVETEGGLLLTELPFVMGVLGDFSGNPTEPLTPLQHRRFISIDRDNFDEVMARMTPGLEFRVANTVTGDGSEISVNLEFNSLEDFDPDQVVKQVEPLRILLETRNKLRDLLTKVDRSDALESLLERILQSDEDIKKLSQQLGVGGFKDGSQSRVE